jgi:hypothetical protein
VTDSIGAISVIDTGNFFDDDDGVVGVEEGEDGRECERGNGETGGAVVFDTRALEGSSTVAIHVLYNWCIQSSCGIVRARSNILCMTLK